MQLDLETFYHRFHLGDMVSPRPIDEKDYPEELHTPFMTLF
jgi:hypothetical protein